MNLDDNITETEYISELTLEKLLEQRTVLDKTEKKLTNINKNLEESKSYLLNIESVTNKFKNIFTLSNATELHSKNNKSIKNNKKDIVLHEKAKPEILKKLENIKKINISIGKELDDHNEILDNISGNTDNMNQKIRNLNKKINSL